MLDNPGMGLNATINRWIEQILMFHFKLKHVKGSTFSPDGLSRRRKAEGDEEFPNTEAGFDENPAPEMHADWNHSIEQPYAFEEFKDEIDTRGGFYYTQYSAEGQDATIGEFTQQCLDIYHERIAEAELIRRAYQSEGLDMPEYLSSDIRETEPLLPDENFRWDEAKQEEYPVQQRTTHGIAADERVRDVARLLAGNGRQLAGYSDKDHDSLVRYARLFFLDKRQRLFRKADDGLHKLVVEQDHRMFMLRAAHDSLGHRGVYATKSLIDVRMWWPDLERDVAWYVKTCHMCQVRQRNQFRIPPIPTFTPSLFRKIHSDVMVMSEVSNGHKLVVSARDSLSRWIEAQGLRSDTAAALGKFLLEYIICRWGCPDEIVTDNAPQFLAAIEWLHRKYGIVGIKISPYNSQANGPVERSHADIRQSLVKATGGAGNKWYWFLPQVVWADRVTVRRGLGCSPYYAVTGCHPILPFDIVEATWLVEYPGRIISTSELIGLRAKALAKHRRHIEEMRVRVSKEKLAAVERYERVHAKTIKDFKFGPGDLVLVRNTRIEKSLNKKAKLRYLGPLVVVRRTMGGSYLCCELNGAMWPGKIAAFRVIPYEARKRVEFPDNVETLVDLSKEELNRLVAQDAGDAEEFGRDLQFDGVELGDQSDSDAESE
uniref:Integrase catalytic domain-containing protein n=1 Tax=Mycena chlorophos TaxID=658473 RepID=A0ABQ0L832_MYCCL|nr:predicted protein [Mycena chlorophos]